MTTYSTCVRCGARLLLCDGVTLDARDYWVSAAEARAGVRVYRLEGSQAVLDSARVLLDGRDGPYKRPHSDVCPRGGKANRNTRPRYLR